MTSFDKLLAYVETKFKDTLGDDFETLQNLVLQISNTAKVNGNINKLLKKSADAIALIGYLEGKYESLKDEVEEDEERLYGRLGTKYTKILKRKIGKWIPEWQVKGKIYSNDEYKVKQRRRQHLSELCRILSSVRKGFEIRFKAFEQISNNERQLSREGKD